MLRTSGEKSAIRYKIGYDALQPRVLFLQLLHLPELIDLQPTVLLLPTVKRLFGNPHLADQLHNRYLQFRLLQDRYDLLYSKTLLLHGKIPFTGLDSAQN
jgi:hypothetical protein